MSLQIYVLEICLPCYCIGVGAFENVIKVMWDHQDRILTPLEEEGILVLSLY